MTSLRTLLVNSNPETSSASDVGRVEVAVVVSASCCEARRGALLLTGTRASGLSATAGLTNATPSAANATNVLRKNRGRSLQLGIERLEKFCSSCGVMGCSDAAGAMASGQRANACVECSTMFSPSPTLLTSFPFLPFLFLLGFLLEQSRLRPTDVT